jgi:NAD(P)-dependent dehydrogenase (short-subunit alcohol dehydrogenase family)
VDVKDEAQVAAFFSRVGSFDHLVYTAGDWSGAMGGGTLDTLDLARADGVFAVRFWGALAAAKHAHKQMRADGSITLTDGMVAHRPRKGAAVSTAMAGAIEHLVRGLAVDLAPIRVNAVCPGYIATDIWAAMPEEMRKARLKVTERYPVPRAGEPGEAAEAYLYLMRGGYTTGQVLYVDGGMGLV